MEETHRGRCGGGCRAFTPSPGAPSLVSMQPSTWKLSQPQSLWFFMKASWLIKPLVIGDWFNLQPLSLLEVIRWDWKFNLLITGSVPLATSPHPWVRSKGHLTDIYGFHHLGNSKGFRSCGGIVNYVSQELWIKTKYIWRICFGY